MKLLLSVYTVLLSAILSAQVEIDKPLIFSSESDEEKKVKNIGSPASTFHLSKAEEIQKGSFKFDELSGGNLLEVNLSHQLDEYIQGLMITLKINNSNTGAVQIQINELDPIPLLKKVTQELAPNDILSGQIIQVIYDGEVFQLMNQKGKKCPDGFVDANSSYCIENEPRPTTMFYNAVTACNQMNARLCSWGEWFFACTNNEVPFTSNSDWEWTNSNAITRTHAKTVGASNSCFSNSARNTDISSSDQASFRCCYDY